MYEVGEITHQRWIFPAALFVAAVYAIARYSGKWVRHVGGWLKERARRLTEYPGLVVQRDALKAENLELDDRIQILEKGIGRSYRAGLREGHAQFIGAFTSREINPLPTIVSVALNGGKLLLTGQVQANQEIFAGTRFTLIQLGTGQPCGVIGLTAVAADHTFTAEVIEETMPAYWAHLRERADHDFSPPQHVTIQHYLVPPVPAEEQPSS